MLSEPNRSLWNFYTCAIICYYDLCLQILTFKVKFKDDGILNYTFEK